MLILFSCDCLISITYLHYFYSIICCSRSHPCRIRQYFPILWLLRALFFFLNESWQHRADVSKLSRCCQECLGSSPSHCRRCCTPTRMSPGPCTPARLPGAPPAAGAGNCLRAQEKGIARFVSRGLGCY